MTFEKYGYFTAVNNILDCKGTVACSVLRVTGLKSDGFLFLTRNPQPVTRNIICQCKNKILSEIGNKLSI
jgi:hypothetical protein